MAEERKTGPARLEIRLGGEIDHHRAAGLMRELEERLDQEAPREVELDLSGVSFMDSSGIALLIRVYRALTLTGGAMRVVRVPRQPGKVLRAAGLSRLFPISYQ